MQSFFDIFLVFKERINRQTYMLGVAAVSTYIASFILALGLYKFYIGGFSIFLFMLAFVFLIASFSLFLGRMNDCDNNSLIITFSVGSVFAVFFITTSSVDLALSSSYLFLNGIMFFLKGDKEANSHGYPQTPANKFHKVFYIILLSGSIFLTIMVIWVSQVRGVEFIPSLIY